MTQFSPFKKEFPQSIAEENELLTSERLGFASVITDELLRSQDDLGWIGTVSRETHTGVILVQTMFDENPSCTGSSLSTDHKTCRSLEIL